MAEKKVANVIKLQIPAGAANPAPPVGPALGAAGVNIMQFCQAFNAETQDKKGDIIPVEITVFEDKSFSFITKTPPVGPALGQHGVNIAAVCRSIINQVRYMVSENTGASIRSIDVCVDSMNM